MGNVEHLVGNRGRLSEIVFAHSAGFDCRLRNAIPQPGRVDCGINCDVTHVDTLGAEILGQRLCEHALRRFRCGEARVAGDAAISRGVAGDNDRTAAPLHHLRPQSLGDLQQRCRVDAEVLLECVE